MNDAEKYTECRYDNPAPSCAASYVAKPVLGIIGRIGRELRILEAGCGNGAFAMDLVSRGHRVAAFDRSVSGIELAHAQTGAARFFNASVYDDLTAVFPNERFDVAVALEVVEHLYSPARFLANLRSVLRDDGVLILSTPYHGYLKNLALAVSGRLDQHFTALWEGGHIKFWSRATLETVLVQSGFVPIEFRGAGRFPLLWRSMILVARRR